VSVFNRSGISGWLSLVAVLASGLLPLVGCGGSDVNEVLRQLVDDRGLNPTDTSLTIRISDQTEGLDEKITLRIDGLDEVFECPAKEKVCSFPLTQIPDTIEAIQEERYDTDGGFQGGRVFEGLPGFSLDRSDYGPGSIIVFLLGADSAEARVL
jgi:hypothetical protein